MEKFGFLHLHKCASADGFTLHSCCERLYESILQCIHDAKQVNFDVPDHPDYIFKIAYFKVLNNNELVKQIHSPAENM